MEDFFVIQNINFPDRSSNFRRELDKVHKNSTSWELAGIIQSLEGTNMNLRSGDPQAVLDALKSIYPIKYDMEFSFVMFFYTHYLNEYVLLNTTGVSDPVNMSKENISEMFSVLVSNQEIKNIFTNLQHQVPVPYPYRPLLGQGLESPKTITISDNKKDLLDRLQVIIAAKHAGH